MQDKWSSPLWILHRWRLLAGAAVFTVVCWLWLDGSVRVSRVMAVYQAWQTEQARLADVASWQTDRHLINRQRRLLRQRYRHLYVSLPRHDQMSALLHVLHDRADSLGVELLQVRPGERTTFAKYDALPLEIQLSGAFHSIGGFVHAIEQSTYLMKVDRLQVRAPDVYGRALQASLSLQIMILKAGT